MPNLIDVKIKEVREGELLLELSSGHNIVIPHNNDEGYKTGDNLKLGLHTNKDIINHILNC